MQFVWQRQDIPVSLMLEVQFNFVAVSGINPTVEIYKFTDDTFLDFDTDTFVSSGGTKQGALSGVPSNEGLYRRSFDPQTLGEIGNQIYYMRYRATIPSGFQSNPQDKEVIGTEIHYFTGLSGIKNNLGMSVSFIG